MWEWKPGAGLRQFCHRLGYVGRRTLHAVCHATWSDQCAREWEPAHEQPILCSAFDLIGIRLRSRRIDRVRFAVLYASAAIPGVLFVDGGT